MQQFMQQPELLCRKPIIHRADACNVAAGPVEAGDDASLDRVGAGHEQTATSHLNRCERCYPSAAQARRSEACESFNARLRDELLDGEIF
jgi:hypothetical protein